MLEIKYRAYDKRVDGELGVWEWDEIVELSRIDILTDRERYNICRYTGKNDDNGKEVYVGDICRVRGVESYSNNYVTTEEEFEMVMVVVESDYSFKFRDTNDENIEIFFCETYEMVIEVMGSIHRKGRNKVDLIIKGLNKGGK